jgi:hypothetical protein
MREPSGGRLASGALVRTMQVVAGLSWKCEHAREGRPGSQLNRIPAICTVERSLQVATRAHLNDGSRGRSICQRSLHVDARLLRRAVVVSRTGSGRLRYGQGEGLAGGAVRGVGHLHSERELPCLGGRPTQYTGTVQGESLRQ